MALYPPEIVHDGRAEKVGALRQEGLDTAYRNHPERFVKSLLRHQNGLKPFGSINRIQCKVAMSRYTKFEGCVSQND